MLLGAKRQDRGNTSPEIYLIKMTHPNSKRTGNIVGCPHMFYSPHHQTSHGPTKKVLTQSSWNLERNTCLLGTLLHFVIPSNKQNQVCKARRDFQQEPYLV